MLGCCEWEGGLEEVMIRFFFFSFFFFWEICDQTRECFLPRRGNSWWLGVVLHSGCSIEPCTNKDVFIMHRVKSRNFYAGASCCLLCAYTRLCIGHSWSLYSLYIYKLPYSDGSSSVQPSYSDILSILVVQCLRKDSQIPIADSGARSAT